MFKYFVQSFIGFYLICFANFSLAEFAQSSHFYIFHINGINTKRDEAVNNLRAIQRVTDIQSNMVTWELLYNHTEGLLNDVWDVIRQKGQEKREVTLDDYVIAYMRAYHLDYEPGSPEYLELKKELAIKYLKDKNFVGKNLHDLFEQFRHKVPEDYPTITNIFNDPEARKHAFVFLVPHSQGTLYADQLSDFLFEKLDFAENHMEVMKIADVTGYSTRENPNKKAKRKRKPFHSYYTGDNDFVINAVRFLSRFLGTKVPVIADGHLQTCNDYLCHSFQDAYLADDDSRDLLSGQIDQWKDDFVLIISKS